jgi:hypothetical protein
LRLAQNRACELESGDWRTPAEPGDLDWEYQFTVSALADLERLVAGGEA